MYPITVLNTVFAQNALQSDIAQFFAHHRNSLNTLYTQRLIFNTSLENFRVGGQIPPMGTIFTNKYNDLA